MSDYLVEIQLRLEAPSAHDAEVWASKALEAADFDDPSVSSCAVYVTPVQPEEEER
jgi:hypothetical protein